MSTPAASPPAANSESPTSPVAAVVGPCAAARQPTSAAEVAAVVAALAMFTGGGDGAEAGVTTPRWRFSGRWWSKPLPERRDRP